MAEVTLFTNSKKIAAAAATALSPIVPLRPDCEITRFTMPSEADCVISTAALATPVELLAMRLGAQHGVIVLPEGSQWLFDRAERGDIRVIVGADMTKSA